VAGRQADLDEDAWWNLTDAGFGHGHSRHPHRKHRDGGPSDEQRRFGVRYRDGRTATTLDGFPRPPVLIPARSPGSAPGFRTRISR
jgi:hypothetical protein